MGSFHLPFSTVDGAYCETAVVVYHIDTRFLKEFFICVVLERGSVQLFQYVKKMA